MKLGIESVGPGRKDDGGKVRVELLPVGALLEVAKVMTFGANKYGANNWQNVTPRRRYYGAAIRHLWARARGEKIDSESGLPHLAHAACCVLFMLSAEVGHDDPDAFEDEQPAEPEEVKGTSSGTYEISFTCEGVRFDGFMPSPDSFDLKVTAHAPDSAPTNELDAVAADEDEPRSGAW